MIKPPSRSGSWREHLKLSMIYITIYPLVALPCCVPMYSTLHIECPPMRFSMLQDDFPGMIFIWVHGRQN